MKREMIYRTDAMAAVGNLKGLSDTDKSKAMQAMLDVPAVQTCDDAVSRADVIELVKDSYYNLAEGIEDTWAMVADVEALPAVQPEPLSDAYTKAVWTWLLDYQIKAAKLKGRYTPYEVLSWVANDWRKEHE